ncbi:MAG: two-component sensor histidine kinase [Sphingomonas sp. 28-66-16]|nr:MAG: two-component sensor histidine kinase [Sphingomonas sp. 28-66-16]
MAIYLAMFLVALLAVRTANYLVANNALRHEVDRRLAAEAAEFSDPARLADWQAMAIRHVADEQQDHESADLYFMLLDKAGRHLAGRLHLDRLPPMGFSDFGREARVPGVDHGRALARRFGDGSVLVIVSDNDDIDRFDSLLFRVQLVGLGITALIVIGGALWVAFTVSGRMRTMQRTVDAVVAGNLQSRIALDGSNSEFDRQAASFNKMLDRIGELMSNVRHAAKDVTHELKSPLARLRSRIAALVRRDGQGDFQAEAEAILAETDQIIELFASLMRLWEIEGGHRRDRFEPFDLAELIDEVVDGLAVVAEDDGHHLSVIAGPPAPITGDRSLMRQLLVNLIENAVRHTPPGTRIRVATDHAPDGRLMLVVEDDGPGIPADKHALVVRRFGRLEQSAGIRGQGLGLTLVDAIVRLHDGALRLEDAAPGLRVVATLPGRPGHRRRPA